MQFISDKEDFLIEKGHINKIFDLNSDLPKNIFNSRFKYFNGFEFDIIYGEKYFNNLKSFLNQIGDTCFSFYTILPSAENYFLKHFHKYSVARIDNKNNYDDYIDFLETDPGNSPADALVHNGETIAMYSSNDHWAMLGSRDCEIGIVGFTDKKIQSTFIDAFGGVYITDVKTRANDLGKMLHFKGTILEFYDNLSSNYKDRL